MPFSKLKQKKQVEYMQLIHQRALDTAKAQSPPLFAPQGRLSIETRLTELDTRLQSYRS